MDLDETRQLAVAAIRLAASMFSTEAEAWAEGEYGDPDDDELPPAAAVLSLFRRANRT